MKNQFNNFTQVEIDCATKGVLLIAYGREDGEDESFGLYGFSDGKLARARISKVRQICRSLEQLTVSDEIVDDNCLGL